MLLFGCSLDRGFQRKEFENQIRLQILIKGEKRIMKKPKMLVATLAAGVMLMGAGYAYWTQDLTITNTVSTGYLDFTMANVGATVSEYASVVSSGVDATDKNKVNIAVKDMYPGATAKITFDVNNTGTLKALVKNFEASDFTQKGSFIVNNFKVNGTDQLSAPSTLATLKGDLAAKTISIDTAGKAAVEIDLQIDPAATEAQIAENLTGANAIQFSITADGLQYNDNVN